MSNKRNNFWLSRLDYLFLLRPMLFFPGWSTLLAGYYIEYKSEWVPIIGVKTVPLPDFLLFAGFALIMGSSFVLNQLQDIASDKKNRKLFIISDGILSVGAAKYEVIGLTLISFFIAFWIKMEVGIFFVVFFIITGILYNYPPARLKDRPWGSLLANMLMGWLAFGIGWISINPLTHHLLLDSLPYIFYNTALYLFTTLPDREGDQQSGKKTLAVVWGLKKIIQIAFYIYIVGFALCFYMMDLQAFVFYIFTLPWFIKTMLKGRITETNQTTKYGILFFALSVCLRWPAYFLIMVVGFYGTKFYYKKRFNFDYPNFSG